MKRLPYFALLGLVIGSSTVAAKCLNRPDLSPECRYPSGDTWCLEQGSGNPYAYSDTCLKQRQTASLPSFNEDEEYGSVRQKMLQADWKPYQTPEADSCYESDSRCANRPEMFSCAATGMGNCMFLWIKNNAITAICTVGDDALFDRVCEYNSRVVNTVQSIDDNATPAQILNPYQGWWRYPDNEYGCDDEDNQYRVALGSYEYNQDLGQVVFGQGSTGIGLYDESCELSNGTQQGQSLQFAAKCTLEEGEIKSGTLRITVRDQNNIAVRFPYAQDYEMWLIRCPN
ncbi:hypothetical protein [Allochromatium palmeri]|uniref:Conjugal transfer protein TraN n=1 Tax=Allochromatium palmeri TaxID=231048 RepID=A0A6N8EIT5_9GAMM|nr:hypothetical protein [Allochromatium palmeri]MTW22616.1 hypothetical protein [Allochromatium palmeri]